MLSILVFATALGGAGVASPSAAGPAAPSAASTPANPVVKPIAVTADKADADDPVTCQSVEVTGSMFTERRCLHRSQWAQQARDGQDMYDGFSTGGALTKGK